MHIRAFYAETFYSKEHLERFNDAFKYYVEQIGGSMTVVTPV